MMFLNLENIRSIITLVFACTSIFSASAQRTQTILDLSNSDSNDPAKTLSELLLNFAPAGRIRSNRLSRISPYLQVPNRQPSLHMKENEKSPILLRAALGEEVEHTPVWMMRQAGRHMQVYRDLCKKHKTFIDRSTDAAIAAEITLQPVERYGTDGAVLFSDITTPFPAMGVNYTITDSIGPVIDPPIRTREEFKRMSEHTFSPEKDIPFVGEALRQLRESLGPKGVTVLGFIGLPFTLATYVIEGRTGTKTNFQKTRELRASDPQLCKDILSLLASHVAQYAIYQIENGAHVIQIFDSWAGHLTSEEYDEWVLPYQKMVVKDIKKKQPQVPIIIYMAPAECSTEGKMLTRLAASGADIVSVDHTIDLGEAKRILSEGGYPGIGLQGNLDPEILRDGPKEKIKEETERILKIIGNKGHVMNLGHGIEPDTPEEHAEFFVKTVQTFKHASD